MQINLIIKNTVKQKPLCQLIIMYKPVKCKIKIYSSEYESDVFTPTSEVDLGRLTNQFCYRKLYARLSQTPTPCPEKFQYKIDNQFNMCAPTDVDDA